MTVHYNLFGGTVLKLGTKTHHDAMLAGIDRLDPTGCFALTELGYGQCNGSSNVVYVHFTCFHAMLTATAAAASLPQMFL